LLSPGPLRFLKADIFPSTIGKVTPAAIDIRYKCESRDFGVIPISVNMNFEATVSEWHITVFGENYLGDVDIFRDIYIRLPNDGLHTTQTVVRTSLLASWQHWRQHFTSGIKHLNGKLKYGNDEVFRRFADAVLFNKTPEGISADDALRILKMQYEVIVAGKIF
jgi:hypothetical protein